MRTVNIIIIIPFILILKKNTQEEQIRNAHTNICNCFKMLLVLISSLIFFGSWILQLTTQLNNIEVVLTMWHMYVHANTCLTQCDILRCRQFCNNGRFITTHHRRAKVRFLMEQFMAHFIPPRFRCNFECRSLYLTILKSNGKQADDYRSLFLRRFCMPGGLMWHWWYPNGSEAR